LSFEKAQWGKRAWYTQPSLKGEGSPLDACLAKKTARKALINAPEISKAFIHLCTIAWRQKWCIEQKCFSAPKQDVCDWRAIPLSSRKISFLENKFGF